MRLPRGSCWLLVLIAIAMVLGHICALPFHAHAGAITTHQESESHHGHDGPDDDALHAASCDAVKTAAGAGNVVVLVPIGTVPSLVLPSGRQLEPDASVILGSPPLFLLHAVLLI